jgi:hypothetical protein
VIQSPSSNASGLVDTVTVEWEWTGPPILRFEAAIQEVGSPTEFAHLSIPFGQPNRAFFEGLPANRDYFLQVSAHSASGAESVTCIAISTGKAGDANRDEVLDGKDLFCLTLVWRQGIPANQSYPATPSLARVDLNGDERVDTRDLILLLGMTKD